MSPKTQTNPTVGDLARILDQLAPPALAQSWDNVGLLVGDPARRLDRVLLCIDLTPPVLAEAITKKCNFILAYHPPLFKPVPRLRADSPGTDAIIHDAIAAGMAIYSPHTALDAAPGGTNDILAEMCGLSEIEPFEYISTEKKEYKLVTFVPPENLDTVAAAVFDAGAGRIGDYEQCSYRLQGEGTFFGTETTHPRRGQKGRLEKVSETRIEVVVPDRRLPEVIAALRESHPYEEPAFDLYPLAAAPQMGIGRVGLLKKNTTLADLARSLKRSTGSNVVMTVGQPKTKLQRAAVCVGAAGRLPLERPRSADCDVIVTGEIRHHDALTILRTGKTAIALGHWESERPSLTILARKLKTQLAGLKVVISHKDRGPFAAI